ncbi:sensor histidine kinase [Kitasatospora sp. HPMI-4]|uniref:sensor histidine kinase n=1 Tax=Kitasatospora sp. HPMI-4 TaxID=3448443 RepID=UPI003F1B1985
MTRRRRSVAFALGAAGGAACGALGVARAADPVAAVPAAVAAALLLWLLGSWPYARARVWPAVVVAGLSLTATAVGLLSTGLGATEGAAWQLATCGALLVLLAGVVRWAPAHRVVPVGGAAGSAITVWVAPYLAPAGWPERISACAFWSLAAVGAAALGGYPRWVEQRRQTSIEAARREQRLQLTRDLHDFVAHDVGGMVAQAQAARFVAATDSSQSALALERIETAGQRALAAMDRMVHALHEDDAAAPRQPTAGVEQLDELVGEFSAIGAPRARLHLVPGAREALSREAGSTAYRVVTEALTNVRRHAPRAGRVTVTLTPVRTASGPAVAVRVVDDGPGERPDPSVPPTRLGLPVGLPRRGGRGGYGLLGLAERVRAVGGTLSAGPGPDGGGWQVLAVLPSNPAPGRPS